MGAHVVPIAVDNGNTVLGLGHLDLLVGIPSIDLLVQDALLILVEDDLVDGGVGSNTVDLGLILHLLLATRLAGRLGGLTLLKTTAAMNGTGVGLETAIGVLGLGIGRTATAPAHTSTAVSSSTTGTTTASTVTSTASASTTATASTTTAVKTLNTHYG